MYWTNSQWLVVSLRCWGKVRDRFPYLSFFSFFVHFNCFSQTKIQKNKGKTCFVKQAITKIMKKKCNQKDFKIFHGRSPCEKKQAFHLIFDFLSEMIEYSIFRIPLLSNEKREALFASFIDRMSKMDNGLLIFEAVWKFFRKHFLILSRAHPSKCWEKQVTAIQIMKFCPLPIILKRDSSLDWLCTHFLTFSSPKRFLLRQSWFSWKLLQKKGEQDKNASDSEKDEKDDDFFYSWFCFVGKLLVFVFFWFICTKISALIIFTKFFIFPWHDVIVLQKRGTVFFWREASLDDQKTNKKIWLDVDFCECHP